MRHSKVRISTGAWLFGLNYSSTHSTLTRVLDNYGRGGADALLVAYRIRQWV